MIDVVQVLEGLGIEYEEKNSEGNALCPMHWERTGKDDHSPSWWINLESGMHICFSCNYKGNILQLICDVNQFYIKSYGETYSYDYIAAQNWLSSVAQIPIEKLKQIVAKLPNYLEPVAKPLNMSEARLAVFVEPPAEALASRKITPDAAKTYGLMWDEKKANWILPLREPHSNKLLGWQEKGTINRTFMNRPTGLSKSKTLFGVDVQDEQLAIVVESPLDCARIQSAGFRGAVAICGATPSEEQIKLLRYSDRIIAAFDNAKVDKAGRKACEEMRQFGRKYGLNLSFFNYGDTGKKDPGDLTDEEIAWGIQNAKSALLGEKAYV